ncbi:MAG: SusC/RagA family TonB-linked outer membrane protein, partial [Chitinophagaceae bacterium]
VISGKHNSVSESTNTSSYYTFETFGEYKYTLKDIHNFDAVAGYSLARSTGYGFSASRQGVPFNSWAYADISAATGVNSATNTNASGGSSTQNLTRRNLSYFGRINYDYKDKYLASFSARRDGSIAFGPKNKFANFFAGSVGWVATKEDFFKVDFIDYLKIRSSYGSIGNENVSPQYVGVVTGGPSYSTIVNSNGYTFGGVFIPGSTIGSFVNEVLRWEKQIQFNAGFDIRVLKNKVSLSADYFTKAVDGLLFNDPPSLYAGTSQQVASNIGTTETKGFDLSLGYNTLIGKDFKFNTSVNFTTSNNMVTATNTDGTAFYSGGSYFNGVTYNSTRFAKGFTPGHFYGFKTDGLFQNAAEIAASPTQTNVAPGDIKFVDANGDGKISDLDKVQIGDPFPDYTIGWNLGFEFKNFEFTMFTYLSQGNDVYRAYERNDVYTNKWAGILNRWTGEGTTNDARYPRHVTDDKNANWRVSDRFIEDGSFVKIKNVMLGYTVPPSLYKNKLFSKILVYVQVKNLLTITKASGYDPELGGGIMETGVDRGNYPQARTIAAGIDIRF